MITKNRFCRFLSLILISCMFFSILTVSASAVTMVASPSNGTSTKTYTAVPNSSSGNIMRKPADLTGCQEADEAAGGFWGQSTIKRNWVQRIVFMNTLRDMPKNTFDFSANRNNTVIGWYNANVLYVAASGMISLNEDSSWMFAYFTNLEEIDFNNSVDTSAVRDMDHMFFECRKLETLDVSGFQTSNAKTMEAMFFNCKKLDQLDVSHFDTSKVTSTVRMFYGCEKLTVLDVSRFDTHKVTDMSFMFSDCKRVRALDVSRFNTSEVQYMNSMFYRCESVKTLDVSHFDTSHVIGMCYMFGGCTNLESLDVSNFSTASLRDNTGFLDDNWTINGRPWQQMF